MTKTISHKASGEKLATTPTYEHLNAVDIAPLNRGRCNRCHRAIILRYTGQKYGPVCIKKIEYENGNAKDENNRQTRLRSFVSKSEVV